MPETAPARLAASGETSYTCTAHPAAARLRAMGNPMRPSPMKPTSPFAMSSSRRASLARSGHFALPDLAVLDLAAPAPALVTTGLQEFFEALEVAFDAPFDQAERVCRVLDRAFGVVVELQHHPRAVVRDAVKGHGARVPCTTAARPGDPLIRPLLDDLGFPLLVLASDGRAPAQALVVE